MPPRPLSPDDIQATVRRAIEDARSFIETEIAPDRIDAQEYYDGGTALEAEDGRSSVVATKVRDTIRAVKPVLMRVFLQTDKPVQFTPRHPGAVAAAQQATSYAAYVFARSHGFQVLSDAFDDALLKKVGVVKVYFDETPEVEVDEYTGLPPEALALFEGDPEVEVLEQSEDGYGGLDLRVARTCTRGKIRFGAVAPEHFFVDANATGPHDYAVMGHAEPRVVGDVVAMGFDFDEVLELAGEDDEDDAERAARTGHDDDDGDTLDPSLRPILLTEAYVRMDKEGTGVPRLYKVLCAGRDYTILTNEDGSHACEPADMDPFAIFECSPVAHAFFGHSLADLIVNDQDAATSLLRGLLDGIAHANNPRIVFNETLVNAKDVMNNEVGAAIRAQDVNAIREIVLGTAATASLPAMQYFDEQVRAKTGVMGAAMGMDADALQSQTASGVNAAVQAAQAQSELIARHLAEGGMRQLFDKIAQLARQHSDPETMIRVDGQFVPVDPRSWVAPMDVVTNVGLGTGRHEERAMVLQQTLQVQQAILQAMGPQNPLVSLTNVRATLADILAHAGVHNADRYFQPMTPQIEQQIKAQQAQAQQGQPKPMDPSRALLEGEQVKAQVKSKELQLRAIEARADDDFRRDELEQELYVEKLKLAQKANEQEMRARMEAQRQYGPPMPPPGPGVPQGGAAPPRPMPAPPGGGMPMQRPPMAPQGRPMMPPQGRPPVR